MKLDQALKLQEQGKNTLYGIYRSTCEYRYTFEHYLERQKAITYHPKLPWHVKEYLRGYKDALFHLIQTQHVYFGFMLEGKVYDYSNLPEYGKQLVREEKIEGHHYWLDYHTRDKTTALFS